MKRRAGASLLKPAISQPVLKEEASQLSKVEMAQDNNLPPPENQQEGEDIAAAKDNLHEID